MIDWVSGLWGKVFTKEEKTNVAKQTNTAVPKKGIFPTQECYSIIKYWESIKDGDPTTPELDPYICPGGWVTQGWGHVLLDERGRMLHGTAGLLRAKTLYQPITMEQAESLLKADVSAYANHVRRLLQGDTTYAQFDAMVSLCFNIGMGAFTQSSVLRFHNAGNRTSSAHPFTLDGFVRNVVAPDNAADAFLLWNRSGGRRLDGLVNRRKAERALYLGKSWMGAWL